MKRDLQKIFKYFVYILAVLFLLFPSSALTFIQAQTPGLIVKPATGIGKIVLDPNGDGYVSAKTNGVQLGFINPPNNDVSQSEIPYVAIVKPDPVADVLRGGSGNNTEIIGIDAAGNNAVLTYTDGTNVFYRFRIDRYSTATLSYSILIDTDRKFGLTGFSADPNAVSGNPGFEIEVVLEANKGVFVYNVDGTTSPVLVANHLLETNYQKSVAITYTSGTADYFYDFYVPLSDLTSIVFSSPTTPTSISESTLMRYAAVTSMNPFPAIGNSAISDVGGVTLSGSIDDIYKEVIDKEVPTVPGGEVLDPSACPVINPVKISDTTISGTSSEASGTSINVSVYQSNETTLIGSGSIITSGSNWSINVSALSPVVTLANGQIVKCIATAPGKGISLNCNSQTVRSCTTKTPTTVITSITEPSSGKGYKVANTTLTGTIFTLYTSSYTQASIAGVPNPITTTGVSQDVLFTCGTGNCFTPVGVYYITVQQPGECVSDFVQICPTGYAQSSAPTISTSPINTSTTSIQGNGTSANSIITIYANGVKIASTTSGVSPTFAFNATVSSLSTCQQITAKQVETGKCISEASNSVSVTKAAIKPLINGTTCYPASNAIISGTSSDANGTTITLYTPNTSGAIAGTATVTNGAWSVSGLSLTNNQVFVAKATAGSCLTSSPDSDPMAVTLQTSLVGYTINFNPVIEESTSVSGTISGLSSSVTLKLYNDGIQIGAGVTVSSNGVWTVNNLAATDLYIGGKINVTLTSGSACESLLSSVSTTVMCNAPIIPGYTPGSYNYCLNGTGLISLDNSESGVVYQLVNSSGVAQGSSVIGNGNPIVLSTNILTSNLTNLYVKAYKILNSSCSVISSSAINFDTQNPSPSVTFTNTFSSVQRGNTSSNLPYSSKTNADQYTIEYSIAAKNQGFVDVSSLTAIPVLAIPLAVPATAAIGTYTGTIYINKTSGNSCITSYGFSVSVYGATSVPVISVNTVGTTICSGGTANLSVAAVGSGTLSYQWQKADTYNGTYSNVGTNSSSFITASLTSTTYYKVVVSNTSGSITSNIAAITVTSLPSVAGTISGSLSVCKGQNSVFYQVPDISSATSYEWSYSGLGATIGGNTNPVYISFDNSATSGTLTVYGKNSCGNGISSNLSITVNVLPTIHTVSGGGTYCSGGSGVSINLSGSETNVNYQLYQNSNPIGSPVVGSGFTISFNNQTLVGNYTVIATNSSGCSSSMAGSVNVSTMACTSTDLSVSKTVDNPTPLVGTNVIFTITATNHGSIDATNVKVTDLLASGYSYVSDNSSGKYNSSSGEWDIGSLTAGTSITITITVSVKP